MKSAEENFVEGLIAKHPRIVSQWKGGNPIERRKVLQGVVNASGGKFDTIILARVLDEKITGTTRPLYAIACERFRNGTWFPDIVYTHAIDAGNAKFIFMCDVDNRRNTRIVGIAPVIGYNVVDEKRNILSV